MASARTKEQLWEDVLALAAKARRIEEAEGDCTKADAAYMDALFAYHDLAAAPSHTIQQEG